MNQRPRPQFQIPQHAMNEPVESANRRVFKVPMPSSQQFPLTDRYMKPPPMQQPPLYYLNRPVPPASMPQSMQMQQRPSIIPYQDLELHKSAPPTPALQFNTTNDEDGSGKLEPVVTLQMLQSKKNGNKLLNLPSIPHEVPQDISMPVTILPKNHKEDQQFNENKKVNPSVYVVYPVSNSVSQNLQPQSSEIIQNNNEEVPMPSKNEYQNTPFAVVTHFEQQPLLMKKDKKRPNFPYQIERPNPPAVEMRNDKIPLNFNAQQGSIYNIGEQPHEAAAISSKLTRITEKPIAIAYTPTEPSRIAPPMSYYQHIQPQNLYANLNGNKYSLPDYAHPVVSEILDEKHVGASYDFYHNQHFNSDSGEDHFHKQHYDFEAPFHASVSLNPEVTNPYEGWTVVTKSTENNKIDRSDVNVIEPHLPSSLQPLAITSAEETTTKKFDPNEFQPVFETGFQPIYTSNRIHTAPEISLDSVESSERHAPSTLTVPASTEPSFLDLLFKSNNIESTMAVKETTTTSSPLITTTSSSAAAVSSTTVKSGEKKKVEIDSLEAFFDSLTRDYDDEEDETAHKSENESSRSV
jgi:hypothetical protein